MEVFGLPVTTTDYVIIACLIILFAWYTYRSKTSSQVTPSIVPANRNPLIRPPLDQLPLITREELRKYNGRDGNPVYVGICGLVYDCTAGKDYYGPGGDYEMFAGRDISHAAGKFSTELKYLDDPRTDLLTLAEKDSMRHFDNVLSGKYPCVGKMPKYIPPASSIFNPPSSSSSTSNKID